MIADFAAGSGELLKRARQKWPSASFLATDINKHIVSILRQQEMTWLVGRCDFLSQRSKKQCNVTSKTKGQVCVVLLNPPFSCRGGHRFTTTFKGSTIRCSLAVVFVFESLAFLRPSGQLVALLPAGCLTSEKDRDAWRTLNAHYEIETFGSNDRNTFDGCSAETVIVRVRNRKPKSAKKWLVAGRKSDSQTSTRKSAGIKIFRGKVPMYLTNGASSATSWPLIHSTELSKTKLDLSARRVEGAWESITGPAVFLPRVGRPYRHKIKLYLRKDPLVLSDCVIALQCETPEGARNLRSTLLNEWDTVKRQYRGTCAKYITLGTLSLILESLGFKVLSELDPTRSLITSKKAKDGHSEVLKT